VRDAHHITMPDIMLGIIPGIPMREQRIYTGR
jgi:hypothetical protein